MLSVLLAASALLLASCGQGNGGSAKIGQVDLQQLLQSPAGTALQQSLSTPSADQQKKFAAAFATWQKATDALKANTNAAQTAAMQAKVTAAKTALDNMQQDFVRTQNQQLQTSVQQAIATVAQADGLSAVVVKQAVLFGTVGDDVTSEVIAALAKQEAPVTPVVATATPASASSTAATATATATTTATSAKSSN